jgi:heme-degrading monooxygenase HmoA
VQRLETGIDVQLRILANPNNGVAQVIRRHRIDRILAHLTGAVNDVDHRHGVRGLTEVGHDARFYPTPPCTARSRIQRWVPPHIGQDEGMITEHAELPIIPGREEEFEAAFAVAKQIIAASPGFGGLTLSRNLERPSTYLLLVQWGTLHDHQIGFRESPGYSEWTAALHHFYSPAATVEHYEVVATV